MLLLADMTIAKAAATLHCNEKSLVRIMRYGVKKAIAKDDLFAVDSIAIDETSFKKRQSYVTVVIVGGKRRIIDVKEGRAASTVAEFSKKLEEKGGDSAKIAAASSDLSKAYRAGIDLCCPYANHTVDKFHVKKLLLDVMDEVRKSEQRALGGSGLHCARKTLMIPEGRMTDEQRERIEKISQEYPKTGRAFRMVQALDTIYARHTPEAAAVAFKKFCQW